MSDIISDLYYGKLIPCKKSAPDSERFQFHKDKYFEISTKLQEKFDEETLALFQEYNHHADNLSAINAENTFKEGFTLGGKFMETMLGN